MLIDYPGMTETVIPNFKGGEQEIAAQMFFDGKNRIMHCRLRPGASIGTHTHETSSEIVYLLAGTATAVCDGATEQLSAGQCHYCPKGSTHTLKNTGTEDAVFFAVVPEQ